MAICAQVKKPLRTRPYGGKSTDWESGDVVTAPRGMASAPQVAGVEACEEVEDEDEDGDYECHLIAGPRQQRAARTRRRPRRPAAILGRAVCGCRATVRHEARKRAQQGGVPPGVRCPALAVVIRAIQLGHGAETCMWESVTWC